MTPEEKELAKRKALALAGARARAGTEHGSQTPGLGVTHAQPQAPKVRSAAEVLQEAQALVGQIDNLEADALRGDIRQNPDSKYNPQVYRDPNTGQPFIRSYDPYLLKDQWDTDEWPDAVEDLKNDPWTQRQSVVGVAGLAGYGDEIAGKLAGPGAADFIRDARSRGYEERPAESFLLEAGASLPAMVATSEIAGLRTGGAISGGVYSSGIADSDDPLVRAAYGGVGAVGGGLLTSSGAGVVDFGKGAANMARRLRRSATGRQSVTENARDEFGIRLTQGQATDDLDQIAFEHAAARGGRSPAAAQVMRPFMDDQGESVRAAGRGIAGNVYETPNQAGAVVQEGLSNRASEAQSGVTAAYDAATAFNSTLRADGVASMPAAVLGGVGSDGKVIFDASVRQLREINPRGFNGTYPQTSAALTSIENLSSIGSKNGLPFEQLEFMRRSINDAIGSAQGPDKRSAVQVKRAFDKYMDDAVDAALFDGDAAFLTAYKNARGLSADFSNNFRANRLFEKIIERDASPEQTLEYILGAVKIGNTDRTRQIIPQLKRALGEDSLEWAALQEAAIKRVMAQTDKTYNPKVLMDNLDEMLRGRNQTVVEELFTADQVSRLHRFRGVVAKLVPPVGAINHSGTAYEIRRQLGNEASRIFDFPGSRTLQAVFSKYLPDRDLARANRAISGRAAGADPSAVPVDQLPRGPRGPASPSGNALATPPGDPPAQGGIPPSGNALATPPGDPPAQGGIPPFKLPIMKTGRNPSAIERARGKDNEIELLRLRKGQIQRDVRATRNGSEYYGARPQPDYDGGGQVRIELDEINQRIRELNGGQLGELKPPAKGGISTTGLPIALGAAGIAAGSQEADAETVSGGGYFAQLEYAKSRVSVFETETIPALEAKINTLESPDVDPREKQRILRDMNYDLEIDGNIGPITRDAIRDKTVQLRADLKSATDELEKARASAKEIEQRAIYADSTKGSNFLREAAPYVGMGLGVLLAGGKRGHAVKKSQTAAQGIENKANALLYPGAVTRGIATPGGLNQRAANINEFWRMGGAGDNVPFKTLKGGQNKGGFTARPKASEPSTLFAKKPHRYGGSDATIMGTGAIEGAGATYGVVQTEAKIEKLGDDVSRFAKAGDMAGYERAMADLETQKDMLAIWQFAQRMGATMAAVGAITPYGAPYAQARPRVNVAETENALLQQAAKKRNAATK